MMKKITLQPVNTTTIHCTLELLAGATVLVARFAGAERFAVVATLAFASFDTDFFFAFAAMRIYDLTWLQ